MKKSRQIALNWALTALAAIALIYGIVSLVGTMPAVTIGGYQIPIDEKDKVVEYATVPRIASQFWLLIVPLPVFAVRYFYRLVKSNPKEAEKGGIAGTIVGTAAGIIFGAIAGTAAGIIFGAIVGTIFGAIAGTIAGTIFGMVRGTIFGTIFGTVQFLIYAVFLTPYHGEWLIALPGIAVVLFIVNASLVSVLPALIAVVERLFSREFWSDVLNKLNLDSCEKVS